VPDQATQANTRFDLGQNVVAPLIQTGGEIAKIYVAGEVAKSTAKELRKAGANGSNFALLAGVLVVGVLGVGTLYIIAKK
jgi:hypothetical protein